jgi:hypothetical protein
MTSFSNLTSIFGEKRKETAMPPHLSNSSNHSSDCNGEDCTSFLLVEDHGSGVAGKG